MATKKTVYEIVTAQIVEQLEKGIVPWKKPWKTIAPLNLVSKKTYRGINPILLTMQGFSSPYWLSYKQCAALGGQVRKGEKGTTVIFWSTSLKKKKDKKTGEDKMTKLFLLRYYNVFNVEQCDGLTVPKVDQIDFVPVEKCEEIVRGYTDKPKLVKADHAYFSPSRDELGMPAKGTFSSVEAYYAVLFHELTHSTGSGNRLDRKIENYAPFGSEDYSKEELVAELGAAFLSAEAGISDQQIMEQSVSYIDNWLKRLKSDSKLIVMAAAQAQKSCDYILDKKAAAELEDFAAGVLAARTQEAISQMQLV